MGLYTVISEGKGEKDRRNTTLEAESEDDARARVQAMNDAIADQEQTKSLKVTEVTSESSRGT